jgi:hypothetical protein
MVEIFIGKSGENNEIFIFYIILPDGTTVRRNPDDGSDLSNLIPFEGQEAKMSYFTGMDELEYECYDVKFGTIHDITPNQFYFTDH